MKLKNQFFYTLREEQKEEDSVSGNLLVRSGMVKKQSAGIYMFLPLGYKVLKNIEKIIREEMNNISCQELLMPALISRDLYDKTGRTQAFGSSVFRLKDRFDRDYILGPTHEELFTIASLPMVRSYKDLPYSLYQFENKFRDEPRPRYGLIRVREFIMKDAYTFDKDLEGLDKSYQDMRVAYSKIFDRMKLDYKIVKADTGVMGGLLSEEYQAICNIGEDTIVLCDTCDYSSNLEIASCINNTKENKEKVLEKELCYTPNAKTIEEVADFFDKKPSDFVKTLIYKIDGTHYALLVKGDDEVNETKVLKLLNAMEIELASLEDVETITNAKVGFAGPIDLKIKVIVDNEVANMKNFIVGANLTDNHFKNVNLSDFTYEEVSDIRNIKEGDICPSCNGKIHFKKGIEVGNIFKLGTKYSESLGLNYLDQDNILKPVVMGSHGIGLARTMAAIVEQYHDEKGIVWPFEVAPYKVCIVPVSIKDETQMNIANELYNILTENNIDTILDDRDERMGVKLNDMDLIGIPVRVLVGRDAKDGLVELKYRNKEEIINLSLEEVVDVIIKL